MERKLSKERKAEARPEPAKPFPPFSFDAPTYKGAGDKAVSFKFPSPPPAPVAEAAPRPIARAFKKVPVAPPEPFTGPAPSPALPEVSPKKVSPIGTKAKKAPAPEDPVSQKPKRTRRGKKAGKSSSPKPSESDAGEESPSTDSSQEPANKENETKKSTKTATTRTHTIDTRLAAFKPLYAGPEDREPLLKKYISEYRTGSVTVNPHGVSAACREMACARTLVSAYKAAKARGVEHPVIHDVFGNKRTVKIGAFLTAPKCADAFDVVVTGDVMVPSDMGRRFPVDPEEPVPPADAVLIQFIYSFGHLPLSPQLIAELYSRNGDLPPVYWVGQLFDGAMGAHFNEQAWVRTSTDTVEEMSDETGQGYESHPALDWLYLTSSAHVSVNGQSKLLAWQRVATVGDIVTYAFTFSPVALRPRLHAASLAWTVLDLADPKSLPLRLAAKFSWLGYEVDYVNGLFARWARFTSGRKVIIDLRIANDLFTAGMYRSAATYSLKNLQTQASAMFSKSTAGRLLLTTYPQIEEIRALVDNTALYAYSRMVRVGLDNMRSISASIGHEAIEYNEIKMSHGRPVEAGPIWPFFAVPGAIISVLGIYAMRRYSVFAHALPLGRTLQFTIPDAPDFRSWIPTGFPSLGSWIPKWIGYPEMVRRSLNHAANSYVDGAKNTLLFEFDKETGTGFSSYAMVPMAERMRAGLITSVVSFMAAPMIAPFIEETIHAPVNWAGGAPFDFILSTVQGLWEGYERAEMVIRDGLITVQEYPSALIQHVAVQTGIQWMIFGARRNGYKTGLLFHFLWNTVVVSALAVYYGQSVQAAMTAAVATAATRTVKNWFSATLLFAGSHAARQLANKLYTWWYTPVEPARPSVRTPPLSRPFAFNEPTDATPGSYSEYLNLFYHGRYEDAPAIAAWVGNQTSVEEIEPVRIKSRYYSNAPIPDPDPNFKFEVPFSDATLEEMSKDQVHTGYWYVSPVSAPFLAPAPTDANLVHAVRTRLLKPPPMDGEEQQKAWENIVQVVEAPGYYPSEDLSYCITAESPIPVPTFPRILRTPGLVQDWITNVGGEKRLKYQNSADTLEALGQEGAIAKYGKETRLLLKSNEVLGKGIWSAQTEAPETAQELKPRFVAVTSTIYQALIGPETAQATRNLKKWWPVSAPSNPQYRTKVDGRYIPISVAYGSKSNDKELSLWRTHADHHEGLHWLVAGDDNYLVANIDGHMWIGYFDASAYDQSQGVGPLASARKFLHAMGAESNVIDALKKSQEVPYVVYLRTDGNPVKLTISRSKRRVQDSGGPTTTFTNGVNMGTGCVRVGAVVAGHFAKKASPEQLTEACMQAFAALGFKMTGRVIAGDDADQEAEFLKGSFIRVSHHIYTHVWCVLPSRRLKAGKTYSCPAHIYYLQDVPRSQRLITGSKLVLYDLAVQYNTFVSVPILRAFVARYLNLADRGDFLQYVGRRARYEDPALRWKTAGTGDLPSPTEDALLEWMMRRYKLTPEEVREMESLEAEGAKDHWFTFLKHPGYLKLAERDYA